MHHHLLVLVEGFTVSTEGFSHQSMSFETSIDARTQQTATKKTGNQVKKRGRSELYVPWSIEVNN